MTASVPSGCAGTISHRERTLIVSRLPTCSADFLECCARNARGTFGLTQTIPRGATVGARLHRVNAKFRRPTSGLTQVATADPASMADGATVSSPSVIRPSRISGPGGQAAPERPLFALWMSVDTGITARPRARHGPVLDPHGPTPGRRLEAVGAEQFVLGTDLGQTGNPSQADGYAMLVAA